MSQQPDSSPRITRRLETPPVDAATTPGDGKAGPQETPMPDDGGLLGQIAEWYDADNARMAQRSRDRSDRMSDTREALARLIYEHERVGRSCIGCRACPDLEFMNGHEHAEHIAELIAAEFAVAPWAPIPLPEDGDTE